MEDNLMRRRIMGMLRSIGGGIAVDGVVFSKSYEYTAQMSGWRPTATLNHNFGVLPKLIIAYAEDGTTIPTNASQVTFGMLILFVDRTYTGLANSLEYLGCGFSLDGNGGIATVSLQSVVNGTSATTVQYVMYGSNSVPIKFEVYA